MLEIWLFRKQGSTLRMIKKFKFLKSPLMLVNVNYSVPDDTNFFFTKN